VSGQSSSCLPFDDFFSGPKVVNTVRTFLFAQLISSSVMMGIIWFVQIVHYPLLQRVGTEVFREYHAAHTTLTSWVVAGPMLLELISSAALLWLRPPNISRALLIVNLLVVCGLWISTAFVQVPLHNKLANGFDSSVHRGLVRWNWVRTILWTLHAGMALWMIRKF
jgi:hypothetical protein